MGFDGNWNIVIKAPIGKQSATATISVEGDRLSGTLENAMGKMDIDGTVTGDSAKFSGKSKVPIPMTLEYDVAMDGEDAWSGKIKTGPFGTHPIEATRQ